MRNHLFLYKTVVVLLVGALVLAGCSGQQTVTTEEPVERETPVQVEMVEFGTFFMEHEIIGSAMANAAVDVYPKLNGDLVRIYVEKGDRVNAGDALASLDGDDLRNQLQLEQSAFELAQLQYKQIVQSGMASDVELEQARLNVEQSKLRVRQAEQHLANATLEAPISGEVVQIHAQEGQFVTASFPLFQIVDLDPIKLVANVSGNQRLMLQQMEEVQVILPDLGKTVTAPIAYLTPVTNEMGFYTLEAQVSNEAGEIKPGMIAKFIIQQQLHDDVLLVPTESVVERDGETVIFIVQGDRAVRKEVEVIQSRTDRTAIRGDVKANDPVVVRGQNTIDDGNKVRIIKGAQ